MGTIVYKPIGLIHSPFNDIQGMPIQTTGVLYENRKKTNYRNFYCNSLD